jgi:hypothetical protein
MTIVVGLDQHRAQITYDLLDADTGEVSGGRVRPADRESVRSRSSSSCPGRPGCRSTSLCA